MSSKLSLLIVGVRWPPETFLARLIRGLLDRDIQVTVATDNRPATEWMQLPNFSWLHAPSWSASRSTRLMRLLRLALSNLGNATDDMQRLVEAVAQRSGVDRIQTLYRLLPFMGKRWDVIYVSWNGAAITYLPLFDLDIPVVLSCRGSQVNIKPHTPGSESFRRGLATTFDRAAAVHCVSDQMLRQATTLGLDPRKAVVIRPAVDPSFFAPPEERKPSSVFRIVTVGSLNWRKGYEYALQAVRIVRDRDVPIHFDIIGDGPEYQRLLYTIDDLHLRDHVRLIGRVPPHEVRRYLQQSDIFLLASVSEGISNAVLEAMASGLPIVTTDCGGMSEAVNDGVSGFLVPLRDSNAMADALSVLAENADQCTAMGRAARRRILDEFRLKEQADRFARLFHDVHLSSEELQPALEVPEAVGKVANE